MNRNPELHGDPAAVLCGLGSYLPPRVVTNDDLASMLDTSDEWIRTRTGIRQRHVVEAGVATSDLAVEAGQRALKSAGLDTAGAVVLATATPDRRCPATAPEVASRLGLRQAAAFDLSAVCSGFIYALAAGAGLLAIGAADSVLVIGADAFSTILNPADRSTRAIFGDGAGAVVLRAGRAGELGALGPFTLGSDGDGADLITVPAGGSRRPLRAAQDAGDDHYFQMAGQPVYRQAVARMVASSRDALRLAGWTVGQVDWLVCHQANQRILAAVAGRLGLPEDRCISNIDQVGNTAAASIPVALAAGAGSGRLQPGDRVLLTAFGGGLTWGSTLLRWPGVTPA
jgi:3-oxoacyl-[acyl-carrier-protein] synthase-3